MKTVLLISHSKDFFNIDNVAAALMERGVSHLRLNSDRFPESMKISESVDASGHQVIVETENGTFNTKDIGAVWPRKIWHPIIETPMEEKYLTASVREAMAVRTSLFQALSHVPWIDPLPAMTKASDKYYQLRCAQQVGIRIPKTIISNDSTAVKQFYAKLNTEMVCKLHTPLSFGMGADAFFLYTTKVAPEDLDDMDMLSLCPMIFQELIPKAYELRIAYIDGQCFSGKIQTHGAMDWRIADPKTTYWEEYELPEMICEQLRQFMKLIGLSFGAIDIIRHTDGSYVFLEVNPSGEWGMMEKNLGLPISTAIAEGLIQRMKTPTTSL